MVRSVTFHVVLGLLVAPGALVGYEARFNCGGDAYLSSDGHFFYPDQPWNPQTGAGFTAGSDFELIVRFGGTDDEPLHHTSRLDWAYRFDLPSGNYIVECLFGDPDSHGPGNDVFDVVLEDSIVVNELDVFVEAEQIWYALRYRFAVEVADGVLTASGVAVAGHSTLAAISVWDRPPDGLAPPAPEWIEAAGGFAQNLVRWAPVESEDLAGYHLYRASSPEGPYSLVRPDLIRARRYFDRAAEIGAPYRYAVTAVDVYGNEGDASDTVSAAPRAPETTGLTLYEILISQNDWDWLNDHIWTETYVPATFLAGGESYAVGVRYRGSSTRHLPKKSWKVKFADGAVFEGREKLNLNAEWHDRTLMREKLAYDFLDEIGVTSPAAGYVQLLVNGRDQGVYTSVEEVESEFLERVGLDPAGSLYRCYGNLSVLPDTAAYMAAYDKKNNVDEGYGDLIAFIELINYTSTAEFFPTIARVFDLEHFYHYYAGNAVVCNVDFGRDDYFLYHEPTTDVWLWLPWDYNETYGIIWMFSEVLEYDGDLFPSRNNRLISRLYDVDHFRRRHMDRILQLLDTDFSPDETTQDFTENYAEVDESGHLDWYKWWWDDNAYFENGVNRLAEFVQLRTGFLLDEMAANPVPVTALINELMADNFSTVADEFSEYDDWIEITNASATPVSLAGCYLTDELSEPLKWAFPDTVLAPGAFLVVWCDGDTLQGPLHASFRLSAAGEEIGVFDQDGALIRPLDTKTFGPQFADVSFGRTTDGGYAWDLLPNPTPGAPNVPGGNFPPRILWTAHDPTLPGESDTVWVASEVTDESAIAEVQLHVDAGQGFGMLPMVDDGGAHDGGIGDGVYGAAIEPQPNGTYVRYYIEAVDDSGAVVTDPREAPAETYFYQVGFAIPPLFINEFLASNSHTNPDEAGDFDDWLEIFNSGPEPVSLGGKHLTDDLSDPTQWVFPDTVLSPGGFLLVWCDDEPGEGPLHATFKLSAGGEQIGLFESDSNGVLPIDTLSFGAQSTDVSMGRLPDGSETWVLFTTPTPGGPNGGEVAVAATSGAPAAVTIDPPMPNPSPGSLTISFGLPRRLPASVEIFDVSGRRVRRLLSGTLGAGRYHVRWDGTDAAGRRVSSGVYFCRLTAGETVRREHKLLLTR